MNAPERRLLRRLLLLLGAFVATGSLANQCAPLTPSASESIQPSASLRGYTRWFGNWLAPSGPPSLDNYVRFSWSDLENGVSGSYDFASLDSALLALPPGGRLGFGVYMLDTCCSKHGGADVPHDIVAGSSKGFWIDADPENAQGFKRNYVPDWNDPTLLLRWRRLWEEIGRRYDGDPRIAWVDLRAYGNWGEGHLNGAHAYRSGVPYEDASVNTKGAERGTIGSRTALVDAIVKGFPRTRLLAMTDDKEVLLYALKLRLPIPVGMRRDSWGSVHFAQDLLAPMMSDSDKELVLQRWQLAPFVVESYGRSRAFEVGAENLVHQVNAFHISVLGNGIAGVSNWQALDPSQQHALLEVGRRAGYSLRVEAIRCAVANENWPTLSISTLWRNEGVAPPYEHWTEEFVLRAADGVEKVLDSKAPVELSGLLPGAILRGTEHLRSRTAIHAGHYVLVVLLVDPAGRRPTMTTSDLKRWERPLARVDISQTAVHL